MASLLAMAACGVTEPEPLVEPCTVFLVSALTGDTTAIRGYDGPPLRQLSQVVDVWVEGDCAGVAL